MHSYCYDKIIEGFFILQIENDSTSDIIFSKCIENEILVICTDEKHLPK